MACAARTTSVSASTTARTAAGCWSAAPANAASPSARAPPSSARAYRTPRPSPSSATSRTTAASARPPASSASIKTPSSATPCRPAGTPARATTNSWLFPPQTQEVQFDEKWSFVGKKQKHCDPRRPEDAHQGDCWDHVAFDPEHRLVVSVVVGKRTETLARRLVQEFRERTDGRPINLMTSDEYPAYASAIAAVYAEPVATPAGSPGPRPASRLPDWLVYATVHKVREHNRVVKVEARLVLGLLLSLAAALL